MWALLRTPRWLSFTATAIVAIVAFGLLSQWQWGRAQEEEAKGDAVAAGAAAEPVPLAQVVAPGEPLPADAQWRAVTLDGAMDCSLGFLVRNRPQDATNGFWAACPVRTGDGAWVWVNRGWLPAPGPAVSEVPMPDAPGGPVAITGRVRASESGPPQPPDDMPTGQVTHLDTDVLSAEAGLAGTTFDPYVEVMSIVPEDPGGVRPLPLPPADSAQNYSYAGQWLLFAAIAIGGWFYFLRREARDVAQEAASVS